MDGIGWLAAAAASAVGLAVTLRLLTDAELLEPGAWRGRRGAVIGAVTFVLELIALAPNGVPDFSAGNLAAAAVALITVPLVLIDRRDNRLPNPITYGLLLVGLGFAIEQAALSSNWLNLGLAIGFGIMPGIFMLIMVLVSRGGVGMGDAKLAAGLGIAAALTSPRLVLTSMAAAYLIGGLWALALLIQKRATRKTALAFGPFLLAGFWVAYLFLR